MVRYGSDLDWCCRALQWNAVAAMKSLLLPMTWSLAIPNAQAMTPLCAGMTKELASWFLDQMVRPLLVLLICLWIDGWHDRVIMLQHQIFMVGTVTSPTTTWNTKVAWHSTLAMDTDGEMRTAHPLTLTSTATCVAMVSSSLPLPSPSSDTYYCFPSRCQWGKLHRGPTVRCWPVL